MTEAKPPKLEPWSPPLGQHQWGLDWSNRTGPYGAGYVRKRCRKCEAYKVTFVDGGRTWNEWFDRAGDRVSSKPACVGAKKGAGDVGSAGS